jgi:hypothetical protein
MANEDFLTRRFGVPAGLESFADGLDFTIEIVKMALELM